MKFCLHCGEEIDDNEVVCPKCGKPVKESSKTSNVVVNPVSNSTLTQSVSNPSNVQTQSVLLVFGILASIAFTVGLILLAIGGIQEYKFRSEYDLSELTEAGINLVRKYSNYSNSINLLTAGGICAGIGLVADLILIPYRAMLQKNGGK